MPSERMRYLPAFDLAPEPPRPTRDELRARLIAIPHDRLADVLLDLTDADYELLVRLRRIVLAQTDAPGSAAQLRTSIARAVGVNYVAWDEMSGFMAELDAIHGEIRAYRRADRQAALDVVWYFLEALPLVFNSVQGENELTQFANELSRTIVEIAAETDDAVETAERLLRAVAADEFGHFHEIPITLLGMCETVAMKHTVALVAERFASASDACNASDLNDLVRALKGE